MLSLHKSILWCEIRTWDWPLAGILTEELTGANNITETYCYAISLQRYSLVSSMNLRMTVMPSLYTGIPWCQVITRDWLLCHLFTQVFPGVKYEPETDCYAISLKRYSLVSSMYLRLTVMPSLYTGIPWCQVCTWDWLLCHLFTQVFPGVKYVPETDCYANSAQVYFPVSSMYLRLTVVPTLHNCISWCQVLTWDWLLCRLFTGVFPGVILCCSSCMWLYTDRIYPAIIIWKDIRKCS